MGVFRALFGCRGVVGFNGCCRGARSGDGGFTVACISGCSGVIGFNVAMSPRPVCEKVRPARLDVCVSAKKFAQRAENTPILVFLGLLGEFFRGSAAVGAVLGEQFRGPTAAGDPVGRISLRVRTEMERGGYTLGGIIRLMLLTETGCAVAR